MDMTFRIDKPNKIITDGETAIIEVTRLSGEVIRFLIDRTDVSVAERYQWFYHNGYCCTNKYGRQWYLTWELCGRPKKGYVLHHINGDSRNNRRCNIRLVSIRENILFRRLKPNRSTGRRGVSMYADGSVVALIGPNGMRKTFQSIEDAIRARIRFERSYLMTNI